MGQKSNRKQQRRRRLGDRPAPVGEIVARVNEHLRAVEDGYPDVWRQLARMRSDEALRAELQWPDWCWLPLAAAYAVAYHAPPATQVLASPLSSPLQVPVAVIGALGAWRQTKTIYRFDPQLYDALIDTELADRLPPQAFRRLPEWCVYLALPAAAPIAGLFAHLEWDVNQQRPELRLLYDRGNGLLVPGILYLDRATISESMLDVLASALASGVDGQSHDIHTQGDTAIKQRWRERVVAAGGSLDLADQALADQRALLQIAIATVMYLCIEDPDILDPDQPPEHAAHTPARRTAQPAGAPTVWEVGYRIGATLKRHDARPGQPSGRGASPRPHIRRAHWHHYWTGPRSGQRQLTIRWIAPTLVAATHPDELIPTIREPDGDRG